MKAWNRKSVRNFTESLRFNVLFERQRGRIVRDFVYMFIALEKKNRNISNQQQQTRKILLTV